MSRIDLAYIAGFVDGEGCIGLSQRCGKNRYHTYIRIANTKITVLKYIKNYFGYGSIQLANTTYRTSPNCKPCYYYQVTCRNASDMASKLIPYLKLKKRQAELITEFQGRIKSLGYWNKNSKLFDWQKNYSIKIHKLNKKGINNVE